MIVVARADVGVGEQWEEKGVAQCVPYRGWDGASQAVVLQINLGHEAARASNPVPVADRRLLLEPFAALGPLRALLSCAARCGGETDKGGTLRGLVLWVALEAGDGEGWEKENEAEHRGSFEEGKARKFQFKLKGRVRAVW